MPVEDSAPGALPKVFAAAAVCTYYWYRLPALAGFGPHPGTGLLVDLTASVAVLDAADLANADDLFLRLVPAAQKESECELDDPATDLES